MSQRDQELINLEAKQRPGSVISGFGGRLNMDSPKAKAVFVGLMALILGGMFTLRSSGAPQDGQAKDEPIEFAKPKPAEKVDYAESGTPAIRTRDPSKATPEQVARQREIQNRKDAEEQRLLEAKLKQEIERQQRLIARMQSPISLGYEPENGEKESRLKEASGKPKQEIQKLGNDGNSGFYEQNIGKAVALSEPFKIEHLEYKILQGKYIPLVVDPRAISDLAGQVCGRVDSDVYGTQGRVNLLPWGSQVCGIYRAVIDKGQNRVFIVWNRLVREDGLAINIDSPGVDQLGTAGMGGKVDNHFFEMFGNALMISIIGAGASTMGVASGDSQNSLSNYREKTTDAFSDTAKNILENYANIPPTIITKAGSTAKIYVRGDLDFTKFYLTDENGNPDGADGVHIPATQRQQSYFEY